MQAIVIIPTYNEAENVESLISQILYFQPQFDILIVDDNSPDGTGKLADDLSKKSNKIKVLHRPEKDGLGRAYIAGFKYALTCSPPYQRIIQMDADFSHNPKYLGALFEATKDRDISIGSRYISGGGVVNWSLKRKIFSYGANLYAYFWLGLWVRDCTSGFRCFRREVLENIHVSALKSNGYLFQVEMLKHSLSLGYRVVEIPIVFVERERGRSKLGFREIWEAIVKISKLHLR